MKTTKDLIQLAYMRSHAAADLCSKMVSSYQIEAIEISKAAAQLTRESLLALEELERKRVP